MLSQLDTSGGIEPNFATQLTHWIALLEYSVPRVTQHALRHTAAACRTSWFAERIDGRRSSARRFSSSLFRALGEQVIRFAIVATMPRSRSSMVPIPKVSLGRWRRESRLPTVPLD